MHQQVTFFLKLGIFSICFALIPSSGQAQTTDDSKIIYDLEKERNDAIALGEEKTLSNLLDESYYGITASGKIINKFDQLALYKSTNSFITFTAEDVSVNTFESTAIVTGTLVGKTKSGATIGKTRYIYIYLKKESKWKIVIGQETVVIKE
jgi:hypothetical protein